MSSSLSPQPQQAAKPALFDRPLYKDWIVWLAAVAIFAGVSGVVGDYNNASLTPGVNAGMTGAETLDITFAAAFQFFLFGILPAVLRRGYRTGRAKQGPTQPAAPIPVSTETPAPAPPPVAVSVPAPAKSYVLPAMPTSTRFDSPLGAAMAPLVAVLSDPNRTLRRQIGELERERDELDTRIAALRARLQ